MSKDIVPLVSRAHYKRAKRLLQHIISRSQFLQVMQPLLKLVTLKQANDRKNMLDIKITIPSSVDLEAGKEISTVIGLIIGSFYSRMFIMEEYYDEQSVNRERTFSLEEARTGLEKIKDDFRKYLLEGVIIAYPKFSAEVMQKLVATADEVAYTDMKQQLEKQRQEKS